MKAFVVQTFIVASLLGYSTALPAQDANVQDAARNRPPAATQCGDPNIATTFFEGFKPSVWSNAPDTIADDVNLSTGGDEWDLQPASFRAWTTAGQPNTVPLYWFYNLDSHAYLYLTSDTTSPPKPSGYFGAANLIAYVYSKPICDSVPLYCVSKPSDYWYTTNLAEHNNFISQYGWTDCGVAAYVLPVTSTSRV
ncbi:hypothetical protein CVT26_014618 [Gymnopilus dilepis]|uniref:DUF5648 domain-containing protein n=1 Tax=Gymnopilus dilepis TaxID=231916 RepID=A0A409VWQ5_9AGAR|nr:hypothetical protein CVT26_014618 [Gymnopilus dilepis]